VKKWNNIDDPVDPFYNITGLEYPDSDDLAGDTVEVWVQKQGKSVLQNNDTVYVVVQVSDGTLFDVERKSPTVRIQEHIPVMNQVFLKGRDSNGNVGDEIRSDTDVVIYPPLTDSSTFISDGENRSEIEFYVNEVLFKKGVLGDVSASGIPIEEIRGNELGTEEYVDYGIRINNSIYVKVTPSTLTAKGEPIITAPIVVKNSLPVAYNVEFANGNTNSESNDLEAVWDWFDHEVIALSQNDNSSQKDVSTVSWFKKTQSDDSFIEIYRYNDQQKNLAETFIDSFYIGKIQTSLVERNSKILSSALGVGVQYQFSITPNDSIDNGIAVAIGPVTITSGSNG